MALTMMTLAKVALAGAAGYAAARWFSTRTGAYPAVRTVPAAPSNGNSLNQAAPPDESWQPREGGHPGREPVEYGASDRPRS